MSSGTVGVDRGEAAGAAGGRGGAAGDPAAARSAAAQRGGARADGVRAAHSDGQEAVAAQADADAEDGVTHCLPVAPMLAVASPPFDSVPERTAGQRPMLICDDGGLLIISNRSVLRETLRTAQPLNNLTALGSPNCGGRGFSKCLRREAKQGLITKCITNNSSASRAESSVVLRQRQSEWLPTGVTPDSPPDRT